MEGEGGTLKWWLMVTQGGGRYVQMVTSTQYFFNINIFHISYYFHHIFSKKDETQKISGFFQSLALQHLRPIGYEKRMKLPYNLCCPSTGANNVNYVCPYILCKKICTTKELFLYHLKATQHYAYEETDIISTEDDIHEDEEETLDIVDGPCLIPDIEKYLEQPFEIIYK